MWNELHVRMAGDRLIACATKHTDEHSSGAHEAYEEKRILIDTLPQLKQSFF